MKRYLSVFVLLIFSLSACTLIFPAQLDASIVDVDFQDADILIVTLKDADQSYYITVNGEPYDCVPSADQPGLLVCTGPGFKPGDKVTLRLYKDNQAVKALGSIDFTVPDYDPEIADSDRGRSAGCEGSVPRRSLQERSRSVRLRGGGQ